MPDIADQIKRARITNPAVVRGGDNGKPISMFLVEADPEQFWFEVDQKFAPNGYDFHILINNVGLRDKNGAGSSNSLTRRKFSENEVHAIKDRLQVYFLGTPEDPDLPNRLRRPISK